jgi:GR25 family glycosyltransferase involved in LPS biosynthesis
VNSFIENVDVYYINLKQDVDRKKSIEHDFLINNIKNFTRIEAVDGKKNQILIDGLSFSESGCLLSHLKAIEHFYKESKKEFGIILEDDIDISNIQKINFNFYDTLKYHSPENYCLQLVSLTREELLIDFCFRKRNFWDFSTAAYIINKEYAKNILTTYKLLNNKFENFKTKTVVDPRGGMIHTRPVADELIYSLCDTYIYPIFNIKNVVSSINDNDEQMRQVIHSINLFKNKWNNYKTIRIEDFYL